MSLEQSGNCAFLNTCSWKSEMKPVVKCDVYLNLLFVVSIYVTHRFFPNYACPRRVLTLHLEEQRNIVAPGGSPRYIPQVHQPWQQVPPALRSPAWHSGYPSKVLLFKKFKNISGHWDWLRAQNLDARLAGGHMGRWTIFWLFPRAPQNRKMNN